MYISNNKELRSLPNSEAVCIEFVSVLTKIQCNDNSILLCFDNFDGDEYTVKIRCKVIDTKILAHMVLKLLCRICNVTIPSSDVFSINDIHIRRLCFIKCDGLYLASNDKSSIFLQDIEPLDDIPKYLNIGGQEALTVKSILQNLVRLDRSPVSLFKFESLENYDSFKKLIQNTEPPVVRRPLLSLMNPNYTYDSQDDFDSQRMNTQWNDEIEDIDAETQQVTKKQHSSNDGNWTISEMNTAFIYTQRTIDCQCIASDQLESNDTRIYVATDDVSQDIIPGKNTLQIMSKENFKEGDVLKLDITRDKYVFGTNFTCNWNITNVLHRPDIQPSSQLQIGTLPLPKEPFIQFKDLSIIPNETKYVRIVGLFVSCSFDSPNFVNMVFSDFTSNNAIQKYFFDNFLIRFEAKLEPNEGFRFIMYHNQFDQFNKQVKQISHDIRDLIKPGSQNVSENGIICEVLLKVQIFQGRLNLIARECTPITRQTIQQGQWYNDPTALTNLHQLYYRTIKFCNDNDLQLDFKDRFNTFSQYFPLQIYGSVSGVKIYLGDSIQESIVQDIPSLNADISSFEIVDATETFTWLHEVDTEQSEIYSIRNVKLLEFKYYNSDSVQRLELYITNSKPPGFIEPASILRLDIIGQENLKYFNNTGTNEFISQLTDLVFHHFDFKIKRSLLKLSKTHNLAIWCPIECTLEELKFQSRYNIVVKTEQ